MRTVRRLARGGAREATSAEFRRAADDVQTRLGQLGYRVRRQAFTVPAGVSWGVAVGSGTTYNIVATPPGFDPLRPHVVVGAHLDTVPQAPGAEDNASGVAVLLETARLAVDGGTRLPVVWVAFGAEEPRGPGDEQHHFGSQAYVRRLGEDRRAALRGMVSLDRVGVPGRVPVCTGGRSPLRLRRGLLSAARAAGVPARACVNRTSDHWPFEKAGLTVARLGGIDYAGYHSSRDVASVVSPRQLDRVGRVLWQWLRER
jgi:Zn-dependent M28 family amino/carboxypeptidase